MLSGTMGVDFVITIALGVILVIGVITATNLLDYTIKQSSEKRAMVTIAEYVGTELMDGLASLPENASEARRLYLPRIGDPSGVQYKVGFEAIDDQLFINAQSGTYPDIIARQPLYLNASRVAYDGVVIPNQLCYNATRNATAYTISMRC